MPCCCDDPKPFGCFPSCAFELATGIAAAADGVYKLRLNYLGVEKTIEVELLTLAEIKFDLPDGIGGLQYEFDILKPDDTVLDLGGGKLCGVFTTKQSV